jgi:hypothetical protein
MCWNRIFGRTHALAPLLVLATLTAAAQTTPVTISLTSPVPGAERILPVTSILLRTKGEADMREPDLEASVHISGSISGPHRAHLTRCRDGVNLVLTPDTPFAYGEEVNVGVAPPLVITRGDGRSSQEFSFRVTDQPCRAPPPRVEPEWSDHMSLPDGPRPAAAPGIRFMQASDDTLPLGYPPIGSTVFGAAAPGQLFLASYAFLLQPYHQFLLILNNDGRSVFFRALPDRAYDFKVLPDGRLSYYDVSALGFVILDTNYIPLDTLKCGDGYTADPHDLHILPNGNYWLLAYDSHCVDMSKVVPGGDPEAVVIGLILQEMDQEGNVVFEWRSWDHFAITDATHENLSAASIDYVHGNALDIDADGNPIISSRHMDEITKIDRNTGEILWRWGGKHNEFQFLNDSIGFSHQHDLRRLPNGHFTMFDNGNYHDPPHSRAVEYDLDETTKTARLVWQYRNDPDIFGFALGSVQRLENGNTLICWGATNPTLTEVDPDGHPVLSLDLGNGIYSYRAYRFPWVETADIPPPVVPTVFSLSQNFPNPFNGQTHMVLSLPRQERLTITVCDVLGREVSRPVDDVTQNAGTYTVALDLSRFSSGMYICRVAAGGFEALRKLIFVK